MSQTNPPSPAQSASTLLRRLARDPSGNTFAMLAAAVVPVLGLVGGGVDMGRSYLAQTRLQQACDAATLATRKSLGSSGEDGAIDPAVIDIGQRFFDLNFRDGAYGTRDRAFAMTVEDDLAISGVATVTVPTTVMKLFDNHEMDLRVECEAQLNFSDTDVMFVLDTTGSMLQTNPGDSVSRIEALRGVVSNFHKTLEDSRSPGVRMRYGFVPYANNANVGHLLKDEWVVDEWTYQSREKVVVGTGTRTKRTQANWSHKSGSRVQSVHDTYPATRVTTTSTGSGELGEGGSPGGTSTRSSYQCQRPQPANAGTVNYTVLSTSTEPWPSSPTGERKYERMQEYKHGVEYWTTLSDTTCTVHRADYTDFVQEYDQWHTPEEYDMTEWLYKPVTFDVSNWRSETDGCMEERDTYEIYDRFESVDFDRAPDLDIDTAPSAGMPATQWRPSYPNRLWARELRTGAENSWNVAEVQDPGDFFAPKDHSPLVACPTRARKLAEMTTADVDAYMASLKMSGQTYHDSGMAWGGRLLSPTGLFASENADRSGRETSRHLIFLTDGRTEALDIAYSAYGLEPLDNRRWSERPDPLLDKTVELRFGILCDEVKKRNIQIWVIGFGTVMSQTMKECSGNGRWFQAADNEELEQAFDTIASSIAELRVSR